MVAHLCGRGVRITQRYASSLDQRLEMLLPMVPTREIAHRVAKTFGVFLAENMRERVPGSLPRSFTRLADSLGNLLRVWFFFLLV